MSYEQILYSTRGDVAIITLNRPDRLNAWTPKMSAEMTDAMKKANDDTSVGAVVFTGAGRGFCAGADIESQFKAQLDGKGAIGRGAGSAQGTDRAGSAQGTDRAGSAQGTDNDPTDWVRFIRASKPCVAAINGAAVGIGLTLVLPMDQIFAAEGAKLSCRFVKMGITPELASSHFLVQRCGWGAASDLALSGRTVEAAEAQRLGLVDVVVRAEELLDAAIARAQDYAANPDPQLRMIKLLLTQNGSETDIPLIMSRESEALAKAMVSPEFAEAVDAFLNKRAPKFR